MMDCEGCVYLDEITNACTNVQEECVEGNAFVKALEPEDMFKVLFMLIYKLQGNVDFNRADLDNVTDEMKINPSYDAKKKRYVLETAPQPPQAALIKVPRGVRNMKGLKLPKGKLVLP